MIKWPSEEQRAALLAYLRLQGVSKVVASFSGGGDCGEIERPTFLDSAKNPLEIPDVELNWEERSSQWDDTHTKWRELTEPKIMKVSDIMYDVVNQMVDSCGLDWYNNDGGQGQVVIDFLADPPKVIVEIEINITTSEDHEFDYADQFFGEVEK